MINQFNNSDNERGVNMKRFIGTWKLVTMESVIDNEYFYPLGVNLAGYLTYTKDGFVHVIIVKSDSDKIGYDLYELTETKYHKSKLLNYKLVKGIFAYIKHAISSIAYFGKFEIIGGQIVHYVLSSIYPDWIGISLIRDFEFVEDNILKLSVTYPDGKKVILYWRKECHEW